MRVPSAPVLDVLKELVVHVRSGHLEESDPDTSRILDLEFEPPLRGVVDFYYRRDQCHMSEFYSLVHEVGMLKSYQVTVCFLSVE